MSGRKTYLKVYIKALAAEARIIKAEERKWFGVKVKREKVLEVRNGSFREFERVVEKITTRKRTPEELELGWMGQPPPMFWALRDHRLKDVRPEARHCLLAYGFLRGRPYVAMEQKCEIMPDWDRVEELALRFTPEDQRIIKQQFTEWKQRGEADHALVAEHSNLTVESLVELRHLVTGAHA